MKAILVTCFTACWYWTSSRNAVATQKLVEGHFHLHEQGNVLVMIVLTALQFIAGLVICYPLNVAINRYMPKDVSDVSMNQVQPRYQQIRTGMMDRNKVLVGVFHFLGCFCTNASFAYGTATLVQIVKLMEPIETLILTGTINIFLLGRPHDVTVRKLISVLLIAFGTSLLLIQKGMNPNLYSVFFAVGSGFCMASRNVVTKIRSVSKMTESIDDKHINWMEQATGGIHKFADMTLVAFIPSGVLLLIIEGIQIVQYGVDSSVIKWIWKSGPGPQAIMFHAFFQLFSISVLSLVSAQTHSLLNVGKRVANILVAAFVFQVPLGSVGIIGLTIAAVGGVIYKHETKTSHVQYKFTKGKKVMYLLLICCLVRQSFEDAGMSKFVPRNYEPQQFHAIKNMNENNQVNYEAHSKFVVWMFPFPPPSDQKDELVIHPDETLICAYTNACNRQDIQISKVNLRMLAKNSYFSNYVSDHMFHKVRHFKDFSFHIQAITMATILQVWPGSCVRTLGSNVEICDPDYFQSYDPYEDGDLSGNPVSYPHNPHEDEHLATTNYPFDILKRKEDVGGKSTALSLAPDMDSEEFVVWGVTTGIHSGYNSGEDAQSLASASWLPFVSTIGAKQELLVNNTGYYIANALVSGTWKTASINADTIQNMKRVSLLSIFLHREENYINNMEYLRNYTELVEPFGCRSKDTCRNLEKYKIKSYFSSCLTLTLNLEGAMLGPDDSHYNKNPILKPDLKAIPAEKSLILMVDVVDVSVVPRKIRRSSLVLKATIEEHKDMPYYHMERLRYVYRLLSRYANQAKVVITSRIHVGLPCAAMGIPVIFVETTRGKMNNPWLPGGGQDTGRVEGILDIFHRVDTSSGKNTSWTFGDLSGLVPPNPGNHLADRYRASFWNRLKRTSTFYADTAKLFGIVNFDRLGKDMIRTDLQDTFHFILRRADLLNWQTKRSIEHVFYYHPNAQVYVHSNDMITSDLEIFVESGYSLVVQSYDVGGLLREIFGVVAMSEVVNQPSIVPYLLLWKFGGVYISKNTFLQKEIPLEMPHGDILESDDDTSMIIFKKHSSDVVEFIKSKSGTVLVNPTNYSAIDERPYKSSSGLVLSQDDTEKCMNDESWNLEEEHDRYYVISLDQSIFSSVALMKRYAACFAVIEKACIYCDEINWEY